MLSTRLVAAGALVLGVALAGCSTSGSQATNAGGYVSGDSIRVIPPADRKVVPDFSGPLVGGGHGGLASADGKVVVLNVWASWCGPCRKEAGDLARAAHAMPQVVFLGINTRDDEGNAEAFVRAESVPYPSISDQDGHVVLALQKVTPVAAMPQTLILDRQHRVAAVIYGPTTALTVEQIARPLERRP
jgi:thiol-disulfide isomerase/thioredoxin